MKNNNLLIVTSKCPDIQSDFDGGSILINQLVKNAHSFFSEIDIVYLRNTICNYKHNKINKIEIIQQNISNKNKFLQRIENSHNTFCIIKNKSKKYDKIIITHISNAFHIEQLSADILKKIIIFPMFTSTSYLKANEVVPVEYIEMERKIFKKNIKIITPSLEERQQLIDYFNVNESSISVIPRGFDLDIFHKKPSLYTDKINLIFVGAIRKQKNHKELISICKYLAKQSIDFIIHLVGGYEEEYKNDFFEILDKYKLNKYICYHGVLSPNEVSKLMDICDINISVSIMETFGRSIYEGLLKGLPTIVFNCLHCIWENLEHNHGIIGVDTSKEFVEEIIKLYTEKNYYKSMQEKALLYRDDFDDKILISKMYKEIISEYL